MSNNGVPERQQGLLVDDFLYFFLRMRKPRIRMVVQALRSRYPLESREELARRLIASHAQLSFLGGALFYLPALLPGVSQLLKTLGLVAGASALTRMHLYLILEIALLYGKDIDDRDRVPEMVTVVAATAALVLTPGLLVNALKLHPLLAVPGAGLSATLLTRMVGLTAIQHYAELSSEAPLLLS